MKTRIFFVCMIATLASCNIEESVRDASERCEDEIAKIIQSVESTCLTKDELFEIINSVRARNDQKNDCVESVPEVSHENR